MKYNEMKWNTMGEIDGSNSNGGDIIHGSESIGGLFISEISLYAMGIEFEMKQQDCIFNSISRS